jgi:hypothetical protein
VQNPVPRLAADNNGVILELPSINYSGPPTDQAYTGAANAVGWLVLGIGTQSNNKPSGVTPFVADSTGATFWTIFTDASSSALTSFIDSGSSAYFFPAISQLPTDVNGYFTPSVAANFSATNTDVNHTNPSCVGFQIANADAITAGYNAIPNIGVNISGSAMGNEFDWGLPFFYGRNVYIGIENKSAKFGASTINGPFWAY